ncbi:MAG: ABC transporter permease [Candidatus Aminicenantes bacterium]|nr:ABC transporter permease [Candidatus Aminicenantes bacterium]MDH5383562.1 ABC transporter permease [Candidatus Aminicenantes bacterium]MDH5744366.1 ABC transporter permease [Candidatus Aminicenantes bacterium]
MFGNYFKSTLRNIIKQKWYSLITLAGLTIGITCFILISLYVRYEFSYDRFHENAKNIYRVLVDTCETYMGKSQVTVTPGPLATAMKDEFPEVLKATKVKAERAVIKYEENRFAEDRIYYADPDFLEIFTFPLLTGNPKTALAEPHCLLVSKDMAEKYFDLENPVGKTVKIDKIDYKITGVMENIPGNTHFRFDFLAPFSSLVKLHGRDRVYRWRSWSYQTYVLLHGKADPLSLEKKLPGFLKKNYEKDATQTLRLQPVADIHFHTKANFELEPNADIRNIYLLSAIGIFILLIACFNYMNLSTARSATRAKEIGMRKVIGANRTQLIGQFLGESVLFSFISLIFSLFSVKFLLPAFRIFIDRKLESGFILDWPLIMTLLGLVVFIGFVSGSYPSLVLSSYQPTAVLKGTHLRGSKGSSFFRSSLVVSQFTISVALIFCTIVIYKQLQFMRNKELGFIKEYVVTVPSPEIGCEAFENALRQNSQIWDTSASNDLPHNISSAGFGEWDGYNTEEERVIYRNWVDSNFLSFYKIPILQGRGFSEEYKDTEGEAYILNEAAVKAIGWDDPIGKRFGFGKDEMGIVVGVVKDFHFAPLYLNIGPLAFSTITERAEWLSIKINPYNIPDTLAFIERTWKAHSPEGDFSYSFLDDRLDRMYRTEQNLGKTLSYYTFIALLVACLGLFGLASFTTAQRRKEIGIRKVLGATEWNITLLTTKKFIGPVMGANSIAWPVSYFAMHKWLQNFAYRMDIGLWIFILTAVMSFGIAFLTVGYQSVKAALANPVDSLRYE